MAFFFKIVNGKAVFKAAIITQILIFSIYYFGIYQLESSGQEPIISYLWLNFVGCILVIYFSLLFLIKSINKQSKFLMLLSTLAILKTSYDILNDVSLNIYHVLTLIILFIMIGYFNYEKKSLS